MAKRKAKDSGGGLERDVQIDSHYKHPERQREGYVQGSADLGYGSVSGFRHGFTQTGMRHKQSPLGRMVREDSDE